MSLLKWFKSSSPDAQSLTILDMPDLVMRKILEDVDLVSKLHLRKVCRAFQNFIDNTNQVKFKLRSINIRAGIGEIFIRLTVEPGKCIDITIKKSSRGCTVITEYKYGEEDKYKMDNVTVLEEFKICFEGIIKSQKTLLPEFVFRCSSVYVWHQQSKFRSFFGCCQRRNLSFWDADIDYEPFRETLNETLNVLDLVFKRSPMRVEKVSISIYESIQLRKVLSNIDQDSLRSLDINAIKPTIPTDGDYIEIDMDEILEYFPMVNAEKFYLENAVITSPIRSIMHIPDFQIMVEEMSIEELLHLRKIFLTSLGPRRALINYTISRNRDTLFSALGSSSSQGNPGLFYFGIPEQNRCVHIYFNWRVVQFFSIERKEVPQYCQIFDLSE